MSVIGFIVDTLDSEGKVTGSIGNLGLNVLFPAMNEQSAQNTILAFTELGWSPESLIARPIRAAFVEDELISNQALQDFNNASPWIQEVLMFVPG